jgi:outer membrane receptor for ferrienterochelin and colicin
MVSLQNVNTISAKAVLKSELSYYDEYESEHSWQIYKYWNTFTATKVNAFHQNKNVYLLNSNLQIKTLEANSSIDMQFTSFFNTKTGGSYQSIFYDQDHLSQLTISEFYNDVKYPDTVNSTRNENDLDNSFVTIHAQSFKLAGYHENILQVGEDLIFNIGGRFDYFALNKDLTWSPRLNFAYRINPDITIRGAWGHYYQSPIYQQIAYSTASDTNTRSQRAIHYILGAEYNLITNSTEQNYLKLKLEGYYKSYDNLISSYVTSYGDTYYTKKNDAVGRTKGVDLYIMYSTSSFSGWISYSLLKAEQKMLDNNYGYFPRNTDQRHTFDAVANFSLGKNWGLTTRIVYGSGFAYTPSFATQNNLTKLWTWNMGNPNSAYLPEYRRVDFRVSKDFQIFGHSASGFLDISNIFNFDNIQAYQYSFTNTGYPEIDSQKLWPILPTLGLAVRF